ncbi:MAG: site-specific DNA-methyltransferase [Candidatus Acidiferrum sp.]
MPTLQFKGKPLVQNHHLVVPFSELEAVKSRGLSKSPSLHDNLIIEGDNLKALKALLPTYHGKVKCIYIDPPYNTGNEGWIYNDRVNSPMMRDWLGKTVDRDDLTRHDKWCCMMLPRLKLLRELLTDDGAIFVSIDDNEVHHLRALMDEVFGEENFEADVTVLRNPKGGVMAQGFAQTHEHLLVYSRMAGSNEFSKLKTADEIEGDYDREDADGKYRLLELRNTHRQFGKHNRPNLFFPLFVSPRTGAVSTKPTPKSVKVLPLWDDGFEGCWTWNPDKCIKDSTLLIARKTEGKWKVFRKSYAEGARRKPTTVWQGPEFQTEKGQQQVNEILGEGNFYAPKPVGLLKEILGFATEADSIVLDSFAGSGTTAHAVLSLNKEDGGDRRFILCQMPYETKEQEQKKENICESITAERVRRVIKGVPKAKDESLHKGLGGTFSYFKLGKELRKQAILDGKDLPSYAALAAYVFFTATGEEFQPKKMKPPFIGASRDRDVFLIYEEDIERLKDMALNLDLARKLGKSERKKLVFAPTKYLDQEYLDRLNIEFCQLPFEIYQRATKR